MTRNSLTQSYTSATLKMKFTKTDAAYMYTAKHTLPHVVHKFIFIALIAFLCESLDTIDIRP